MAAVRPTSPRSRPVLLALATVLLAAAAAACGGDDGADAQPSATTIAAATGGADAGAAATSTVGAADGADPEAADAVTGTPVEDGAYPVTIEHLWGETTIEEAPERVVTLGVTDADVAIALGVEPIALTGFTFFETGLGPWATAELEGEPPQLLEGVPNIELIASLRPDVIIGVSAGFEEPVYDQLSAIAPTIVRPEGTNAYQVPRSDATRMISAALGRPAAGGRLAAAADDAYAAAVAANPDFAGKTAAVVLPYDGKYGVYTPRDTRGQALAQLGFVPPPALAALDDGTKFFLDVSQEQVALLDADVLVMLADAPAMRAFVDGDAVLQQVPVVRDGRMVVLDTDTRGALTYNSVLSVPFALERIVPPIAAALEA